jgi:hypothetical protein
VGATTFNEKQPNPEKTEKANTRNAPWVGSLLRIISYVLIVAMVGLLIYYVVKNSAGDFKINARKNHAQDFTAPVENIEDLDVAALLKQALTAGNLRMAVRLYYLGLLKLLNEGGIIVWKKDKTNREYLSELMFQDQYFEDVKKLTLAYEQVWYGEHTLTPESFQVLIKNFELVNQKLTTIKAA